MKKIPVDTLEFENRQFMDKFYFWYKPSFQKV